MAIPHAQPGDVIDLRAGESSATHRGTRTLLKTQQVEVIRMELPKGKSIAEHRAPGEMIVQCLAGRVEFVTMGKSITLDSGQMFYLSASEPHAVNALDECQFQVTILFAGKTTGHPSS